MTTTELHPYPYTGEPEVDTLLSVLRPKTRDAVLELLKSEYNRGHANAENAAIDRELASHGPFESTVRWSISIDQCVRCEDGTDKWVRTAGIEFTDEDTARAALEQTRERIADTAYLRDPQLVRITREVIEG